MACREWLWGEHEPGITRAASWFREASRSMGNLSMIQSWQLLNIKNNKTAVDKSQCLCRLDMREELAGCDPALERIRDKLVLSIPHLPWALWVQGKVCGMAPAFKPGSLLPSDWRQDTAQPTCDWTVSATLLSGILGTRGFVTGPGGAG